MGIVWYSDVNDLLENVHAISHKICKNANLHKMQVTKLYFGNTSILYSYLKQVTSYLQLERDPKIYNLYMAILPGAHKNSLCAPGPSES